MSPARSLCSVSTRPRLLLGTLALIALTTLAASLASAQTQLYDGFDEAPLAQLPAGEERVDGTYGQVVEPPPPERFLPESDCPWVEGEPRCIYVVHHPAHGWSGSSRFVTRLRVDARNFSGRPARIETRRFDARGAFTGLPDVELAAGAASFLMAGGDPLDTFVVLSDTRLQLAAHVETFMPPIVSDAPSRDLCLPGSDGSTTCGPDPLDLIEPRTTHHAAVREVDCSDGRGSEFLCRALRYEP